ncbi:MAG: protein TolQ [Thermodesulfobacteriota bacterium]|nr:MAG: protein TolQ [Thermodesulfobacteriota bacterium]
MSVPAFNGQLGIWDMMINAGPVVKLVLLTLLIFSIFSWAIIIYKVILLKKIEKETSAFYDVFWEKRSFSQIMSESKSYKYTPLGKLFSSVYKELSSAAGGPDEAGQGKAPNKWSMERMERILRKTSTQETARIEYAVSFLATAGNTSPFIGLFGTVWGIMVSFQDIGALGSANLAVVAPGISEALVATAVGLLVAIPAVMGYNHILARINRISSEMDNFSSDLLNIVEKQRSS